MDKERSGDLHCKIEPEHHDWLWKRAVEEKTSIGDIVRRLICEDMGVKNETPKDK